MKDFLFHQHRQDDRARKTGAVVVLLTLIGLMVVPSLLESPVEQSAQIALFEPVRPNLVN
jgi:hypothetical protein